MNAALHGLVHALDEDQNHLLVRVTRCGESMVGRGERRLVRSRAWDVGDLVNAPVDCMACIAAGTPL